MNMQSNIIIIGAGISGISCALQLNRYNIDFLIFEKNNIGGLINNANCIKNYPGFNEISGIDLSKKLNTQLKKNRIKIIKEEILSVKYVNNHFILKSNKNTYKCNYLICATGTIPKKPLQYKNFDRKIKNRIFFDILKLRKCKNKNILIIGAGDIAFDYALSLSRYNNIMIFNRGNKIKALKQLENEVNNTKNIQYYKNTKLHSLKLKNNKLLISDNQNNQYTFDYIVYAIGRQKNTLSFLKIDNNTKKLLLKNKKLFFIGDLKRENFKQLTIASGDGTLLAMKIKDLYENN